MLSWNACTRLGSGVRLQAHLRRNFPARIFLADSTTVAHVDRLESVPMQVTFDPKAN
jgi:hypothetical protein